MPGASARGKAASPGETQRKDFHHGLAYGHRNDLVEGLAVAEVVASSSVEKSRGPALP